MMQAVPPELRLRRVHGETLVELMNAVNQDQLLVVRAHQHDTGWWEADCLRVLDEAKLQEALDAYLKTMANHDDTRAGLDALIPFLNQHVPWMFEQLFQLVDSKQRDEAMARLQA
jgi:hypothetical protein